MSPTLATAVKDPTLSKKVSLGPIDNSQIDGATDICEQTKDQFVEYELQLNNQDQYEDDYQSQGSGSDIEENIVTASVQSVVADEAQ